MLADISQAQFKDTGAALRACAERGLAGEIDTFAIFAFIGVSIVNTVEPTVVSIVAIIAFNGV